MLTVNLFFSSSGSCGIEDSIDFILNQSSVLISKSKYNLNDKIINLLNDKLN